MGYKVQYDAGQRTLNERKGGQISKTRKENRSASFEGFRSTRSRPFLRISPSFFLTAWALPANHNFAVRHSEAPPPTQGNQLQPEALVSQVRFGQLNVCLDVL